MPTNVTESIQAATLGTLHERALLNLQGNELRGVVGRRSTDELERQIADWELIRRALAPGALPVAASFIDEEIRKLRHEVRLRDAPKPWGRRAMDPKPTLLMFCP